MAEAKPFLAVSLLWLVVGMGVSVWGAAAGAHAPALAWFVGLFVLCLLDLGALAGLVRSLGRHPLGALVFGILKLGLFAVLGIAIARARTAPALALVFGLATLVVVPLGGGYWWHRTYG